MYHLLVTVTLTFDQVFRIIMFGAFSSKLLYPPQTLFVVGYTVFTLSVRESVRASVRNVLFP